MILIIGARASGKKGYVQKQYGVEAAPVSPDEALHAPAIDAFQELIRQVLLSKGDVPVFLEKLVAHNPGAIIICDEVGMGIVPLDKEERRWREEVGRACCYLARQADTVTRLVCGLPQRLK